MATPHTPPSNEEPHTNEQPTPDSPDRRYVRIRPASTQLDVATVTTQIRRLHQLETAKSNSGLLARLWSTRSLPTFECLVVAPGGDNTVEYYIGVKPAELLPSFTRVLRGLFPDSYEFETDQELPLARAGLEHRADELDDTAIAIEYLDRRTALRTISGAALAGLAGCAGRLNAGAPNDDPAKPDGLSADIQGSALVATFGVDTIDQLNVIQHDGELYAKRNVATGVSKVTVEIGTSYQPGEFRIVGVADGDVVDEVVLDVRPSIEIVDVGLYRNRPDKPWEEVYGESETDRKKNAEAFVTVKNSGSGPDRIDRLRFRGDVPFLAEWYEGSGIFNSDDSTVVSGEQSDLYTDVLPFDDHSGANGLGCVTHGVDGQFTVVLEATVSKEPVEKSYHVVYSGSEQMYDCEITVEEL